MAGWLTDNMPPITGLVTNGTTAVVGGVVNNGTTSGGGPITYTLLASSALVPVDLPTAAGAPPQTVAASVFQIGAHAVNFIVNTGSSTAGAGTLNTVGGAITTESLSTAAGSTYTFTLTNSLISTANTPPSPVPQIALYDNTNTAGATQINSITNGAGSTVVVFQNTGTAAWNGKKVFCFHI